MIGFSPYHTGDRFYNPPAVLRLKQLQQQKLFEEEQERRRRREEEVRRRLRSGEADLSRLDDWPAAEGSSAVGTPSPRLRHGNLDRFLESTTPVVPALFSPQTGGRGCRNNQSHPCFCLGDLWEAFKEWSAYGAGVPLVMNGSDSVVQYYVPYLSGIQLYVDCSKPPFKTRHLGEETDLDPSQETSTDGRDSDIERCVKLGLQVQKSLAESSLVKMDRLSLSEKPLHIQERFSNDNVESASSSLAFEYMERDPPYSREPLAEKISSLASRFPELRTYMSCDLSPCSWISVAWYPIYRIPTGPTLTDLEACFLTYHKLSTPSIGVSNSRGSFSTVQKTVNSADMSPKLSLPVFGLASYKFKASVWTSNWLNEREQATTLMRTADRWLRNLNVNHPDFKFFASHSTYQR